MRQVENATLCIIGAAILAACGNSEEAEVNRAIGSVNVVDESNLNDIMLTVADPNEAVLYFQRATQEQPDRLDLRRGLGKSLIRANRGTEAAVIYARIVTHEEATHEDRVDYADALIRSGQWKEAEAALDSVPPTYETYKRYRLEAMIADGNKEWTKADSFYEIAISMTTQPGSVLNNWGYSKLTRGDYPAAERLFGEAITYDPSLFTAKNNLVLARGAQKKYELPIINVTQIERAQLLHTMALTAVKQGDVEIGKDLLHRAIETHPQHFDAAVRSLSALEA